MVQATRLQKLGWVASVCVWVVVSGTGTLTVTRLRGFRAGATGSKDLMVVLKAK